MKRLIILFLIPATLLAVAPSEYAARRDRLARAIGPDGMLVVLSTSPVTRNADTDYEFRQNDSILYLTGIQQPETSLVLLPSETQFRETLFVLQRDPNQELWTGKRHSTEEAKNATGVANVYPSQVMRSFVVAALEGSSWGDTEVYRSFRQPGMPEFRKIVRDGRAEIWLLLGSRGLSGPRTPEQEFASELRERYPELRIRNASPLLVAQREIKSPAEVAVLQKSIDITGEAQRAGMLRAKTATVEHQIEAAIESTFRDRGACCPAFPTIAAAGRNATVLHYETNQDPVRREDLILTDIGAEVDGYAADITRTYPADGTFSPEQRAIYEAVLTAQLAGEKEARPGKFLADVHRAADQSLGRDLLRLGLITKNEPAQVAMYFRHGVGHHLGLDVHDVNDRTRALEPGMVITIEPGIYVREDDVRSSTAFKKLSAGQQQQIEQALARYGGIGVRIEDDYLITTGASKHLSGGSPRTIAEIESLMR